MLLIIDFLFGREKLSVCPVASPISTVGGRELGEEIDLFLVLVLLEFFF